jgi:hypothetical protein
MPSKPLDRAFRIIPYSKFAENTTYYDHYTKWRVQDSVRNVKQVRWGPKVAKFVGHTTYTQDFRKCSVGGKCNVLMRPKPTVFGKWPPMLTMIRINIPLTNLGEHSYRIEILFVEECVGVEKLLCWFEMT